MLKVFSFSILMILLIVLPACSAEFQFDKTMTADKLWAKVDATFVGLSDYTSDFTVDASSRDIHIKAGGKLSCLLPDRVKFVFEGLPGFLGEHKEVISDHSIQDIIDRKNFSHSIANTEIIQGEPYYIVKSSSLKKDDNLQEARFWIHARYYTSGKIILKYANGGYVKVTQGFKNVGGYNLPSHMNISLYFPEWRAELVVDFSNFALNVGLTEDMFRK